EVAGLGALSLRVHGLVLEDQQQVGQLTRHAPGMHAALEVEGLRIGDPAQLRDPQFGHCCQGYSPWVDSEQRFWPARMRWRLRGAWMWPTFVGVPLLDGFLLHELLPDSWGFDLIPGILVATFAN